MDVDLVSGTAVGGRNDHRRSIMDESHVTDERFIEDGVKGSGIERAALRDAFQRGAGSFSDFTHGAPFCRVTSLSRRKTVIVLISARSPRRRLYEIRGVGDRAIPKRTEGSPLAFVYISGASL